MGKFIVIEGLDGSGKSTQLELLQQYMTEHSVAFEYLHFPRLEQGVFGDLVARFLRGEFGKLDEVNSYLVALLYAGDRNDAAKMIRRWTEQDTLVIVDRYVQSNIAYQCAKLNEEKAIQELDDWIQHLEYSHYNIPKPDLSVFLHVPFDFVSSKLTAQRDGDDRDYLKGEQDIHEGSLDFQQRVEQEYVRIFNHEENGYVINCSEQSGKMLQASLIHEKIISLLKEKTIL